MKYIIILIVNCLFVLYSAMFLIANSWWPKETVSKIRNILLLGAMLYVMWNIIYIYILKRMNQKDGIIYKMAAGTKHFVLNSYVFIQPFKKEFAISLIVAGAIIFISMVLLGLPGALIIMGVEKTGIFNPIEGDNSWPAAIFTSFFWPMCFPVAVLTKNFLIKNNYTQYINLSLYLSGVLWVLCVILGTFLQFGNKT